MSDDFRGAGGAARYGVDLFVGLNCTGAARAGTVVCPATAAAAADTALGNLLIKN